MQAFQEQSRALLGQKQEELKRQSEYLATAFAEAAAKERASRIGALDQVPPTSASILTLLESSRLH